MSQQQWNAPQDEEAQVPLGVGGDSGMESFGGESKPKVNSSTLVLFACFAAAVGVIWLLGVQSKPRMASADEISREKQVESAIAELLKKNNGGDSNINSLFRDTDKLVSLFYNYMNTSDTSLTLPANPFEYEGSRPSMANVHDPVPIQPTNTAELEKYRRVAETFNSLKLQSVMIGKTTSAAMINNRLVSVGAKLGELTVSEIDSNRVILTYGQNKFELKLNRPNMNRD